jgi:hypothetical protein
MTTWYHSKDEEQIMKNEKQELIRLSRVKKRIDRLEQALKRAEASLSNVR